MQAAGDLLSAITTGRTFIGMTTEGMDLSAYWRKSVLSALMAGKIAKACGKARPGAPGFRARASVVRDLTGRGYRLFLTGFVG
ncbi:MAG TPA: hypothetical protein VF443_05795 [Nitrospira sp.]